MAVFGKGESEHTTTQTTERDEVYAITKNGVGQWIVPSYSTIGDELTIATLDTTTYDQGTRIGELIRIDKEGNKWSVRRVTTRQANAIDSARKARQAKLAANWKATH